MTQQQYNNWVASITGDEQGSTMHAIQQTAYPRTRFKKSLISVQEYVALIKSKRSKK